jgi:hypothetical protein
MDLGGGGCFANHQDDGTFSGGTVLLMVGRRVTYQPRTGRDASDPPPRKTPDAAFPIRQSRDAPLRRCHWRRPAVIACHPRFLFREAAHAAVRRRPSPPTPTNKHLLTEVESRVESKVESKVEFKVEPKA